LHVVPAPRVLPAGAGQPAGPGLGTGPDSGPRGTGGHDDSRHLLLQRAQLSGIVDLAACFSQGSARRGAVAAVRRALLLGGRLESARQSWFPDFAFGETAERCKVRALPDRESE